MSDAAAILDASPPPSAPGFHVRRATTAHREAVWPLVLELPRHDPERESFDRAFGSLLSALDTFFAVVVDTADPAEPVVGYILANQHLTFSANGPIVWVDEIAVAPASRLRGAGRALLDAAERWASGVGASRVALASGMSKTFYESTGYTETAAYFVKHVEPRTEASTEIGLVDGGPDAGWAPPVVQAGEITASRR